MKIFLDSNVPIYAAGLEHPNKRASERFMTRAGLREVEVLVSTEVLQEILHIYSRQRRVHLLADVFDGIVASCSQVVDVQLADMYVAGRLLCEFPSISARDAVHAAVMMNNGVQWIASFDRDFDRIPGIRRLEPS